MVEEAKTGTYKVVGKGEIDIFLNDKNETGVGIYKFDGDDTLTLCLRENTSNKDRPKEFSGEKANGTFMMVFARAKPGEEKVDSKTASDQDKEAVEKVREAAARMVSQNNLKQIGLAYHVYFDANKVLPAHAIYSKDGKTPLLSWRVAILPYIEHGPLYNQFKLDEPWDSEHNKKLIAKMPRIYEAPNDKKAEGMTYYQVFTGPDTPHDGSKALKLFDITDGTSNTILAVEAKDAVIWTKPADLTLPKQKDRITPIGGLFKNGTNALFFDGSVRFLARDVSGEQLRALVTPRGGD